jgi:hypothetical protein
MRRILSVLAWATYALTAVATADEPGNPFQGTWHTTISDVTLLQKGNVVTGTYGPAS